MKTLLINNIGNRHLYYKNKFIDKKKFREITNCILDNWEEEKEYIKLNILSQALQVLENKPDKIVLFATDQGEENKFSSQDTLYAAEIVQNILKEDYCINEIDIIPIKNINPSNENSLVPVYNTKINGLHYRNNDYFWQFLDAGGTPQQKFVCKLLIPEIHSNYKFIYLNNVEGIEEQDFLEKKTDAIEGIFTLKNIKNLVKLGHYDSAELLLNNENKALNFVSLGSCRLRNIYDKHISFRKKQKQLDAVRQYTEQIPVINFPEFKDNLTPKVYFLFGEFMARAYLFLQNKNYNNFILNFQQSLELLLIDFLLIEAEKLGFTDLEGNSDNDKVTFFITKYNENLSRPESLPARLYTAIKITKEQDLFNIDSLLKLYAEINDGYQRHYHNNQLFFPGLDVLRNSLVHKGKSVKETDIKEIIKVFEKITGLLNLNKNSFSDLNKIIYNNLFL